MGLFDLLKRKETKALARQKTLTLEQAANQMLHRTETQIREGLSKPTTGTGTQMDKLRGMAKTVTQIANVGGGKKRLAVVAYPKELKFCRNIIVRMP